MLDILNIHKFYRDLEPFPHSKEVVQFLADQGHDLFLVTNAMCCRNSFKSKFDSCEEHYPSIKSAKRMFVGDKSAFLGDILIDDGVHNLEVFDGIGILFDAPHNQKCNKFYRVKNWLEIKELAEKNFEPLIEFYNLGGM